MLLADIRQVFAQAPLPRLFSSQLVSALCALTDRPWPEAYPGRKPITESWLAQRLRPFGVSSRALRIGDQRAKGYELADFTDAFERFLPNGGLQSSRAVGSARPALSAGVALSA